MTRRWGAGLVAAALVLAGPAARGQDDVVRDVIRKGIDAAGGEKVLESLKAVQSKSKGKIHSPRAGVVPFVADEYLQLPDKVRSNILAGEKGKEIVVVEVFDGTQGWEQQDGKTMEMGPAEVAEMKAVLYESRVSGLVPLLKDKEFKLSALPEVTVAGKPAAGVLVRHPGRRDIKLYFDKGTGLLVRTDVLTLDREAKKELPQEKFFSDYKAVQGRQVPHKVTINQNGRLFLEVELTEVRLVDRLDPMLFTKPK